MEVLPSDINVLAMVFLSASTAIISRTRIEFFNDERL